MDGIHLCKHGLIQPHFILFFGCCNKECQAILIDELSATKYMSKQCFLLKEFIFPLVEACLDNFPPIHWDLSWMVFFGSLYSFSFFQ